MKLNGYALDTEPDSAPPHLPWVLLCHASAARCGETITVNHAHQWKAALTARRVHETFCTARPGGALLTPRDLPGPGM